MWCAVWKITDRSNFQSTWKGEVKRAEMVTKQADVLNKSGIHARPASVLVNEAKRFQSRITIQNLNRTNMKSVNAKSMVMVLSLEATQGTNVAISAEGTDEREAVDALIELINNGINE